MIASRGGPEPNVTNEGSVNRKFHADSESAIRLRIRGSVRELWPIVIDYNVLSGDLWTRRGRGWPRAGFM